MADFYCEPKTYPAYSSAPAWGVAQDGDGQAKGIATPATITVDMTDWTFSTSSTVSVMGGVAITCTASATTSSASATPNAQYSATLTTMIDNLVTAINFHSGAVVNVPANWSLPQIRNSVHASRSGNSLCIMTRAGSSGYNSLVALSFLSVTGASSQFWSGGASGAWGYWWNDSGDGVLWPSGVAVTGYGCGKTGANAGPLAGPTGAIAASDIINVRGNGVVLYPTLSGAYATVATAFTQGGVFLFDDGIEWAGDSAGLTIGFRQDYQAGYTASMVFTAALPLIWTCVNHGALKIHLITGSAAMEHFARSAVDNIAILDGTTQGYFTGRFGGASNCDVVYSRCKFTVARNSFYMPLGGKSGSSYNNCRFVVESCTFDFSLFNGTPTALQATGNLASYDEFVHRGNTVLGPSPYAFSFGAANGAKMVVENCTNYSTQSTAGIVGTFSNGAGAPDTSVLLQQGIGNRHQFRLETNTTCVEWFSGGDIPYFGAMLPDGTGWSYLVRWSPLAAAERLNSGVEQLRRVMTVTQSAMQTVTLEMLLDPGVASVIYTGMIGVRVSYKSAVNGKIRTEYSTNPAEFGNTTPLTDSVAPWSMGSTYNTYVKKSISLTLNEGIAQNSEIDVALITYRRSPSSCIIFVDPEIGVS